MQLALGEKGFRGLPEGAHGLSRSPQVASPCRLTLALPLTHTCSAAAGLLCEPRQALCAAQLNGAVGGGPFLGMHNSTSPSPSPFPSPSPSPRPPPSSPPLASPSPSPRPHPHLTPDLTQAHRGRGRGFEWTKVGSPSRSPLTPPSPLLLPHTLLSRSSPLPSPSLPLPLPSPPPPLPSRPALTLCSLPPSHRSQHVRRPIGRLFWRWPRADRIISRVLPPPPLARTSARPRRDRDRERRLLCGRAHTTATLTLRGRSPLPVPVLLYT